MWKGVLIILILIPLFFISVNYNLFNLYGGLPGLSELENPDPDLASVIYSEDGVILGKYFSFNRNPIDFDDLSPNLVNALIATEDRRYLSHSGIDLIGLTRAFVNYVILQKNREGGSTITQQLAKMLWETRSEKYEGHLSKVPNLNGLLIKTKEWLVAIKIERSYTKKEIISMYFNTMPFGNNTYGIKVAAKTYFNKLPSELNIHEAALMVGIVNGPSLFNPVRHPERSIKRRNWVIWQMFNNDYIARNEYEKHKNADLDLNFTRENHSQGLAPYFRMVLRQQLKPWAEQQGFNLDKGGLSIYTSLNSRMQTYAEQAMQAHMKKLQNLFFEHWQGQEPWTDQNFQPLEGYIERVWRQTDYYRQLIIKYGPTSDSIGYYANVPKKMTVFSWEGEKDTLMSSLDSIRYFKQFLHAGMMAMDPHTGQIKAWVGGLNYKYWQYDHVKQGKNQPGSTFKPIVYATAIENGYSPCFEVVDAPVTFPNPGANPPNWTPRNATTQYNGQKMTLKQAMARSVNRIAAFIMNKIGPENVVDMARRLGIESDLEPVMSLSLGSSDVSLYEMIGAYSTFVNDGTWIEPYGLLRIEDKFGNVIYQKNPTTREAISEENAYIMLDMLRGTVEQHGGTAYRLAPELKENNQIGAKTGTTSDFADGWFIGVTEDLVAGVWVGGDDRSVRFKTIQDGQGAVMAMPVWQYFMLKVYQDTQLNIKKKPFMQPKRPISLELDCDKFKMPLSSDEFGY